jgi:hypothetical protein
MGVDTEFFNLIQSLNPYTQTMELGHLPDPSTDTVIQAGTPPPPASGAVSAHQTGRPAARGSQAPAGPTTPTAANFQVEIDNYKGEWSFRGNVEQIKKSLRITYRYPVLDACGNGTGMYATEHLLIGYAGGNH